jgi:hypothetical protein
MTASAAGERIRKTCGISEISFMKKTILVTMFSTLAFSSIARAESVPCEDMLKTLADTMKDAKLNDADLKSVNDLKAKAEERCKAEDDKRSDGFITDAMKIMGK